MPALGGRSTWGAGLQDIPDLLGCVAKLATGHTGTETVITDADGVVFEFIREVIPAFGHRPDEDADTFLGA